MTYEKKWDEVAIRDKAAKEAGKLVGRYISEPYADGRAIYEIIRESKKTVRIRVVTGIGDDWQIPYWGAETSIARQYALENIQRRDGLAALFAQKKEK